MATFVRGLLVLVGLGVMLFGFAAIGLSPDARLPGLSWVAMGGLLVVLVAAERQRYRSATAERTNAPPGPGGGERHGEMVEARFKTTAEVFIDPTTGHRMRVLVDPDSGERRYVAEA
jgi:hypothetical protein